MTQRSIGILGGGISGIALAAHLGENVHQRRRDNIWFKGRLVKYPFENDLASLPPQDNFDCILGYINSDVCVERAMVMAGELRNV